MYLGVGGLGLGSVLEVRARCPSCAPHAGLHRRHMWPGSPRRESLPFLHFGGRNIACYRGVPIWVRNAASFSPQTTRVLFLRVLKLQRLVAAAQILGLNIRYSIQGCSNFSP